MASHCNVREVGEQGANVGSNLKRSLGEARQWQALSYAALQHDVDRLLLLKVGLDNKRAHKTDGKTAAAIFYYFVLQPFFGQNRKIVSSQS